MSSLSLNTCHKFDQKWHTNLHNMCKLEYLSKILRKRSTQIYTICVNLNTNKTFCVKSTRNVPYLVLKLHSILRCFFKKITQLTKNLRERRSHWSRQISTLRTQCNGVASYLSYFLFIKAGMLDPNACKTQIR